MGFNGTTIPTTRDYTYDKTEVHRKSPEELYDTAFNKDQKEALGDFSPSGGSGGGGYECTDTSAVLTRETVVTVSDETSFIAVPTAALTYDSLINADSLFVVFDGVEYECHRGPENNYGAQFNGSGFDWSRYPFSIVSSGDGVEYAIENTIATQNEGTHSIELVSVGSTVTVTPCFEKAATFASSLYIKEVWEEDTPSTKGNSSTRESTSNLVLDHSFGEIYTAFKDGKNCVIECNSGVLLPVGAVSLSDYFIGAYELSLYGNTTRKWVASDYDAYPVQR